MVKSLSLRGTEDSLDENIDLVHDTDEESNVKTCLTITRKIHQKTYEILCTQSQLVIEDDMKECSGRLKTISAKA